MVTNSQLLHFALPHHQASFNATTQNAATSLYLQSATMGRMRAYLASQWTMIETLPVDILFLPGGTEVTTFSATATEAHAHCPRKRYQHQRIRGN